MHLSLILYMKAFHGSSLRNWHSVSHLTFDFSAFTILTISQIIRHGLWYKEVANGRAYGHGTCLS